MSYQILDSHCHITCYPLYERIDEILDNAKNNNVTKMLVMCTDFLSYERAKELQKKVDIDIALGFHPSDLYNFDENDYVKLEEVIKKKEIVALGEIGLDYHFEDDVDHEDQRKGFIRQVLLANKYSIPIIIHMRDATKDCMDILKEYCKTDFLMHCYSGSKETAKEVIKMGGYISFAGPITFKNARGLTEIPSVCPKDKILVETDCPYLTPHPFRGKQNEPMYVNYTFKKVCELLEMDEEVLSKQIFENYKTLFHK